MMSVGTYLLVLLISICHVDFCFVLVMDIFDRPITKTNTQTMDSLKIEDYVALPICLAIKLTRVEIWPKDMGYNVVLLGTCLEHV
jgi:hypothetical protein